MYVESWETNGFHTHLSYCIYLKDYTLYRCQYETNDGQTKTLDEGSLVLLETEDIPKSTDVVILVEAQQCNRFLIEDKPLSRFQHFISIMNEELEASGLHSVRYFVVLFLFTT